MGIFRETRTAEPGRPGSPEQLGSPEEIAHTAAWNQRALGPVPSAVPTVSCVDVAGQLVRQGTFGDGEAPGAPERVRGLAAQLAGLDLADCWTSTLTVEQARGLLAAIVELVALEEAYRLQREQASEVDRADFRLRQDELLRVFGGVSGKPWEQWAGVPGRMVPKVAIVSPDGEQDPDGLMAQMREQLRRKVAALPKSEVPL